jgi:hypothetical protein
VSTHQRSRRSTRKAVHELIAAALHSIGTARLLQSWRPVRLARVAGALGHRVDSASDPEAARDPPARVLPDGNYDRPPCSPASRLRNGNPSRRPFGPSWPGRRWGAKTRHRRRCLNPAMRNGRRRMHGGRSTGPRTPEGLERALARRAGSMASDQRRPCSDIDSTAPSSSSWAVGPERWSWLPNFGT